LKTHPKSSLSARIPPYLHSIGYQKIIIVQSQNFSCIQSYSSFADLYGKEMIDYELDENSKPSDKNIVFSTYRNLKNKVLEDKSTLSNVEVLIIDGVHER
jgi:hypothetical protein